MTAPLVRQSIEEGEAEALEENDIESLVIQENCSDIELIEWLKEPFAIRMIEEYYEEMGSDKAGIISQISNGKWFVMDKIYHMVNDFLEDMESFNRR